MQTYTHPSSSSTQKKKQTCLGSAASSYQSPKARRETSFFSTFISMWTFAPEYGNSLAHHFHTMMSPLDIISAKYLYFAYWIITKYKHFLCALWNFWSRGMMYFFSFKSLFTDHGIRVGWTEWVESECRKSLASGCSSHSCLPWDMDSSALWTCTIWSSVYIVVPMHSRHIYRCCYGSHKFFAFFSFSPLFLVINTVVFDHRSGPTTNIIPPPTKAKLNRFLQNSIFLQVITPHVVLFGQRLLAS